jgi:hypothetical protein
VLPVSIQAAVSQGMFAQLFVECTELLQLPGREARRENCA